jgi:hypothetical protein
MLRKRSALLRCLRNLLLQKTLTPCRQANEIFVGQ